MKLHEWMIKNNLSVAGLADKAVVGKTTLYMCLKFKRPMSGYMAMRIYEAVNKEVPLENIIDPDKRDWKFDARVDLAHIRHPVKKKPSESAA